MIIQKKRRLCVLHNTFTALNTWQVMYYGWESGSRTGSFRPFIHINPALHLPSPWFPVRCDNGLQYIHFQVQIYSFLLLHTGLNNTEAYILLFVRLSVHVLVKDESQILNIKRIMSFVMLLSIPSENGTFIISSYEKMSHYVFQKEQTCSG